jgi:radical SAM superfamily enzyme YgiQ (UPF0313 family)
MAGRVLLLALSGVRIHDAELAALGMTLPGFVDRGEVIARLPSLGLLTLAAHTPSGWDQAYRELDVLPAGAAAEIGAEGWDVVAISSLTARIVDAYALADTLRVCGVTVVLGGLHATACADEAAGHADAVVVGEAEGVWPELLEDWARGALRRRYDGRQAGFRFEQCKVPRWDLISDDRHTRLTLQTTRGCPLDCHFCGASRLLSPYRKKPLARVRAEVDALLQRWPRARVELADDNTFVDRRWTRGLAQVFAATPIRWFTEADLSVADDPELVELLAASGCFQVLVGLESADAVALTGLESSGVKRRWVAEHARRIATLQERGIAVIGCFVLGFDADGPEVFARTLRAQRELGLADVQITLLTPFPGTALHQRLANENRLLTPGAWSKYTLFDVTFRPARMSASALRGGFAELVATVYDPTESARRRSIFRDCLSRRPT